MPNRKKHERISRRFLGNSYTKVHKIIDRPHRHFWKNRNHRFMLLSHHPLFAAVIATLVSRDKFAWVAGLLHAVIDHAYKTNKIAKKLYSCLRRSSKGAKASVY